jgi:hypothetical protein
MSKQILVTKQSLQKLLDNPNPEFVMHVVGKALVHLFHRQTQDEKVINETKIHNNIGFTSGDARTGSLTAKSYLKNNGLEQWQVDKWLKRSETTGWSRLVKYHAQLNEVAIKKSQKNR